MTDSFITPALARDSRPEPSSQISYDDKRDSKIDSKEEDVGVTVREVDDPFIPEGEYTEEEYARLVKKVSYSCQR